MVIAIINLLYIIFLNLMHIIGTQIFLMWFEIR